MQTRLLPHVALTVLLAMLVTRPAVANWPAQGRRVLVADGFWSTGVGIYDLPSGDLLVRAIGNSYMSSYFNVQRATPTGDIAPGWPDAGVSMGYGGHPGWKYGFAIDPNGFGWQVASPWGSGGLHAVDPGGVLDPPGGYPYWALNIYPPYALASAPNGIYAYYNSNHLQRFTDAGTVAPGWPASGVVVFPVVGDPAALPDGSGGVVTLGMATPNGPRTLRVDSSGVKHGGPILSVDPDDAYAYDLDVPPLPALVASDASHYFAVWSAPTPDTGVQHVSVQRAGYNNALAPGWPITGVVAVAPHKIFHVTPLPDHAGGLYLVWYQDDGLPRATHVRPDGTFAPGTDANGVVLFPPGPLREPSEGFDGGYLPNMVADVTPDGRLIFAWDDLLDGGNNIRVRWLLPDLTADPSEPSAGRLIVPNPQKTFALSVHAAPDGGAYVAWESEMGPYAQPGTVDEIWMTRLLPSSLVSATPPAPRALALSAPRPNPARGSVALDVTLPDDSPARVELLDVAGRVVRTQIVQGARTVTFDALASLSPGLYFARATHRNATATTRVVISR